MFFGEMKKTLILFSKNAESFAIELAGAKKETNKITKLRKFYDEVLRLNMEAKNPKNKWADVLPFVHMLVAKAVYARGRHELVSEGFERFIRSAVKKISDKEEGKEDLSMFANFFEALMGFYRFHGDDKLRGKKGGNPNEISRFQRVQR